MDSDAEKSSLIYEKLCMLWMRTRQHFYKVCESLELTPAQCMMLLILKPNEPRSMSDLSRAMSCDASNITGLTDRLEANNYIERVQVPSDKRVRHIKLTEEGIKCRKSLIESLREHRALDMEKLTQQEIETAVIIADKLGL